MSIIGSIGSGVANFTKKIVKAINDAIDKHNLNQKRWEQYKKLKLRIISNLPQKELKKVCLDYGVGEPSLYYNNPLTGQKESWGEPRELYLRHIIHKVPLDSLIDYAKRSKISVHEVVQEKNSIDSKFSVAKNASSGDFEKIMGEKEEKNESEFANILGIINNEFNPDTVRDEKDLENQLKQWLRAKLSNLEVSAQWKISSGDIIDLMIGQKYGLELKLVETNKTLENLYGQVKKYVDLIGPGNLAIILLVSDAVSNDALDKWTKDYEALGSLVVVLSAGKIKRPKRKTWILMHKK